MNPDEALSQSEPVSVDVLDSDDGPLRLCVISYRNLKFTNAELRAIGITNFPGRTPGLPDDDPLLRKP